MLAEFIETTDRDLRMDDWCRCIAGHCCRMLFDVPPTGDMLEMAVSYLGITPQQADVLFQPDDDELGTTPYSAISRDWAVAVVRHFAVTGEIDWLGTQPKTMLTEAA